MYAKATGLTLMRHNPSTCEEFSALRRNSSHVEEYFLAKGSVKSFWLKPSTCEEFLEGPRNSSHVEGFRAKSCSEITVISLQDLALKSYMCDKFFS